MAATKSKSRMRMHFPTAMEEVYYSTLDDGATVVHTLLNQTNVQPFRVSFLIVTPATDDSVVQCAEVEDSWDSTDGANTISLKFSTTPGGDLTGAVVKVFIEQLSQASGGISA